MRTYWFLFLPVILISAFGLPHVCEAQQQGPTIKTDLHIEGVTVTYLPGKTLEVQAKIRAVDGHLKKGSNIEIVSYDDGEELAESYLKDALFGMVRYLDPNTLQFRMFAIATDKEDVEFTTRYICTTTVGSTTASCIVSADGYGSLTTPYVMTAVTGPITPED